MIQEQIASNLYVLDGAVNTGVLVSGNKALLIDCCDTVTPERLAVLGVDQVEMILCTQYRRPNTAGVYPFIASGTTIVAPEGERHLLEQPYRYWDDPKQRWWSFPHHPGPLVPVEPVPVDRGVVDGDSIKWSGYRIRVLRTPGATRGGVSYLLEADDSTFCFCGKKRRN